MRCAGHCKNMHLLPALKVAERAMAHTGKTELLLGGGVACNQRMRTMCEEMANDREGESFAPPRMYCIDNGTMIAASWLARIEKTDHHGPGTERHRPISSDGSNANRLVLIASMAYGFNGWAYRFLWGNRNQRTPATQRGVQSILQRMRSSSIGASVTSGNGKLPAGQHQPKTHPQHSQLT